MIFLFLLWKYCRRDEPDEEEEVTVVAPTPRLVHLVQTDRVPVVAPPPEPPRVVERARPQRVARPEDDDVIIRENPWYNSRELRETDDYYYDEYA